jgi:hypothetical protein
MAVGGQISIGPGNGDGPPDRAGDPDHDTGRRKKELTGRLASRFAKPLESPRDPRAPGRVPGETRGNRGLEGKAVVFGTI